MTPPENIESTERAFAAIGPTLSDGEIDPICRVAVVTEPVVEDAKLFAVFDADSYDKNTVAGVIEVENIDHQEAHLGLNANLALHSRSNLAHDPELVRGAFRAVMEKLNLEKATIDPESDTNLPKPEETLRRAGATALSSSDTLEFRLAA